MYDDSNSADGRPTAMDWLRFGVGGIARLVTWACILLIVGNAVAQSISDGNWVWAFLEAALLPLTFFLHPFLAPEGTMAWPLADGTSLIPFLVAALIAYPISTLVGGFAPIDR